MTKAVLRRLHSPDVPDLSSWSPADGLRFGILIQAMIGPEGAPGEESFDFFVCTPEWLAAELGTGGYRFGRPFLFVTEYNYAVIHEALRRLCNRVAGADWDAVADVLSRYGIWEFEDYDPDRLPL